MHIPFRFFAVSVFLITLFGCNSPHKRRHPHAFVYEGIYFGRDRSDLFVAGVKDGCETAKGYYRKSHELFRENGDYYDGWFMGRNKCGKRYESETAQVRFSS